jgi:hypothetical protein
MTALQQDLTRLLAFNLGNTARNPVGIDEIKLFRVCINVLRQAERDYLCNRSSRRHRAHAEQTLFGLHHSPLPAICRALGLDYIQARLRIIEWEMRGLQGDPVFEYLTQPQQSYQDKYEQKEDKI